MVTFWGSVQVCGLGRGEDLPFPLSLWQFRFLGDFGKKLVINFQEIQMYFIAWILLIFMCIVILNQPSKLWEAQILYTKSLLIFSQCSFLSVHWRYQLFKAAPP